ncbi:2-succinyl-5-enolpyruvyl-6-hydroxy-3-cyclohexene-1-carboxylate synthase [Mariniphaga anaerophila]|uniref:2-succinyl-5-enolpyruvyl-6-hydroxy-3-cyclohexene-1-carboxylate synthase n=1 Tax=Mariniphaga anaerophila TaxID=1484053 RepID=A0A1M5CTV2_9BACT|nr:2-succinyl-5-enolpyruvyl-6-hydroxy-3-cyclohexene-1-carboxylic-acid synthase [Mariniphaga anaerophila]SHF58154.1 2-succinyl-5-enolpyruvyl-6-hydroxy-3-cyclohexene-1-carboxylate synthase [Mariniphaga anaerophila]
MISTKKHIRQLAAILHAKAIENIVISPGSRSGPLVHTFAGSGKFNCRSIVDERSAGYFALGLAQATQKPVVLVCSSGTATLNFAPAVAEAFYQNIPLVVLTADRPDYWINQGENQTLRQNNIYRDFCKKEVVLPMGESEKELWFAGRLINETLNSAVWGAPGPVHINIPLEEPLHDLLEEELTAVKIIGVPKTKAVLPESEWETLAATFNRSEKVLILCGQQNPNQQLESTLAAFVEKSGAVVLKEHLGNLNHPQFVENIDLQITSLLPEASEKYRPDLLITLGGTFVSKPLKQFLRLNKPANHWHLTLAGQHYDTYQSLTQVIEMEPAEFFRGLSEKINSNSNDFSNVWKEKEQQIIEIRDSFISQAEFSDLTVINRVLKAVPENSVVHLGNSSPVRYALVCAGAQNAEYFGNRGTSGIDGSLSTAAGFASASEKLNTVILGDLSFFYDSNALWNNYIGQNLRVVVVHNGGGNIFGMIKGPGDSPAFNPFFFAENRASAAGIAQTFGLDYFRAENESELTEKLQEFYSPDQKKAAVLEVFTDAGTSVKTFRDLFKLVKK